MPVVSRVGENIIFTVSVANFGSAQSRSTFVSLYERQTMPTCNDQSGLFAKETIDSLVPFFQDTKGVIKPGGFPDPGIYRIWVLADSECIVDEGTNEANNAASIFVTVL